MSDSKTIHRRAMECSDLALLLRLKGNNTEALVQFKRAYDLELQAATFFINDLNAEPARSVLLRSAATLAQDCGLLEESERLIYQALSGYPPVAIADELKDLLEQITFQRHLQLRGTVLSDSEMQMALTGDAVGFGMAPANLFYDRVQSIEALAYRTAERKLRLPYRDAGRRAERLKHDVGLFLTVSRAACFAVTFRVGGSAQQSLPGLSVGQETVDEIIDCLDLYARGDELGLRERINEDAYYRNFIGLAHTLQPDGAKIKTVGFTTVRRGETRQVALRGSNTVTPSLSAADVVTPQYRSRNTAEESIEVTGELLIANAEKRSSNQAGIIEIFTASGEKVKVVVPPGMMSDIVRPLWESKVNVVGLRKGNRTFLTQISAAREAS